ncbi:MAG TPA: patatin-like phospholipase family protein [Candidatus Bathyarchaeia archaeon]|nr:patatin-like phospholipase family protein [Candidatus Bathyarchaeia archaeon]
MEGYTFNSKTAFVFSGGASLGAVEVGALRAIVEHNIQADMVLGTSVGSLNGAMYAYNPTLEGVNAIERIWRSIKMRDVFPPSPVTPVVNLTTSGLHLVSPKNLRKLITEHLPFTRIEETKIPLYIISTDIKCGEEVVFNKGLAIEALMSSAGIPGVFPPLHMNDRLLVDGGIINNAPISTAVRLGAGRIVVFPIGVPSSDQEPKNVMEILIRSFIFLLNRQLATDIQLYKDKVELIIIPPPYCVNVGPHDFSKSEFLIDEAYNSAKTWLKDEGYASNPNRSYPCDVHTLPITFIEAVTPNPEKKATSRIKENLSQTSKSLIKSFDEKTDKIYSSIVKKSEELKDKVFKSKTDEDSNI